ncbi:hypothetical protein I3J27_08445 [Bradyrhizobium xenonodulans]|uniref:Glycosyltransferase RgtA/B/C/D-like domain-containing protein n=1 Tax=Bradyrhizobium xenonodulans TaxID=2736875 RepID=A0ABY7MQ13_9BRAD|nr:hypothetical protein [Bradyrhizobium xenonodulans]WBL80434.1 hypothetical protein I3J27_08445 [Bradyrhizobium xenonodulans]
MNIRMSALLDRLLVPKNRAVDLFVILGFSFLFSYLLIGRQVQSANWGIVDDSEVFLFLGQNLHLSASDIWSTLINKTEVGQHVGRFRPTFYFLKVVEAWLFGANVHLWYFVNTVCFALFLGALWRITSRFVDLWLGGALVAYVALQPLWAHIFARLGPSEIFGAASVGLMVLAADAVLFGERSWVRNGGAISMTAAAMVLAGLKETFLPLALAGPALVFALAAVKKKLPVYLMAVLALLTVAWVGAIGWVVSKELRAAGGVDYNAKSVGPGATLIFGVVGLFDAFARTWWIWILPLASMQLLKLVPTKTLREWIASSWTGFSVYAFLIVMYAAQCALYRMSFPHNSRYDFPAMLLVPLTGCLLICEVFRRLRDRHPESVVRLVQFYVAIFIVFAMMTSTVGTRLPIATAVRKNIEVTSAFFDEVRRAALAARNAPDHPIILDAYGPAAYEGVFALPSYLRALGVTNTLSLHFHPDPNARGALYDGLQKSLSELETTGDGQLVPLRTISSGLSKGCLSIGLYGPPDSGCATFKIDGN